MLLCALLKIFRKIFWFQIYSELSEVCCVRYPHQYSEVHIGYVSVISVPPPPIHLTLVKSSSDGVLLSWETPTPSNINGKIRYDIFNLFLHLLSLMSQHEWLWLCPPPPHFGVESLDPNPTSYLSQLFSTILNFCSIISCMHATWVSHYKLINDNLYSLFCNIIITI